MSVVEVIGVYVALPAAIFAILAVLTVGLGRHRTKVVYEPGQTWDHPDQLWAGDIPVVSVPVADRVGTKVGGASGTW